MNTSAFSLDTFLDSTTTDALTRRPPVPAGTEMTGTIKDLKMRQVQGTKEDNRDKTYTFVDISLEFDLNAYPHIQSLLSGPEGEKMQKLVMPDSFSLTFNTAGTGIDMSPGANAGLRRYREATDLNKAGQPFSPRMLIGRLVKAKFSHRTYQGEIFDQIEAVAKP